MKLADARLCLDCSEVFDALGHDVRVVEVARARSPLRNGTAISRACPACASQTSWPLERFLTANGSNA